MEKYSTAHIEKITKQVISEKKKQEKIEKIARMVLEEMKKDEAFKHLVSSIEKEAGIFDKLKKFISTVGIAALLSGGSSDAQAKAQDVVDLIQKMKQEYSKKFNDDPNISFEITQSKKLKDDGRYKYEIEVGPYLLSGSFSSLSSSYDPPNVITSPNWGKHEKTPELIQKYQPLVKDIKKVLETTGKALSKKNIEHPQERPDLSNWWEDLDKALEGLKSAKEFEKILDLPPDKMKKELREYAYKKLNLVLLNDLGEAKKKKLDSGEAVPGKQTLQEIKKTFDSSLDKLEKDIASGKINKKLVSDEITNLQKEVDKIRSNFENEVEDESLRVTPYKRSAP